VPVGEVGRDTADWVASLEPEAPVRRRLTAGGAEVPVVPLTFRAWQGPRLGMAEDCNKRDGRVIGDADELSCAEVEIVKRLKAGGWEAFWVSPFKCGERRWGPYRQVPGALPAPVRELEALIGLGDGGRPDVVAWSGQRVLYLESKGPSDALKPTQIRWIEAISKLDTPDVAVGLVEWTKRGH
jgi:hypothetical protein